ncbi:hypothetical protein [Microbacterium nymphoidis]|jgi:hypothetical protein|uniref:hypothetical protein n=1 Tax=Microbacterium nymphoidis TaxID=2898586 RepID=UPI001E285994|nr:hypothetical protein [Microbacterium nymphoidis]MCD2498731.1 hypothetical protein [Microbacterium nymphoidis]
MGIEDVVNKGKDAVSEGVDKAKDLYEQNKEKVDEALHSEQAEGISDSILDGVAGFAKKVAPGAADKIDEIRDNVDKQIGNN